MVPKVQMVLKVQIIPGYRIHSANLRQGPMCQAGPSSEHTSVSVMPLSWASQTE